MAKKKKGWMNPSHPYGDNSDTGGYSEPPPAGGSGTGTGMWAKSQPPPAFGTPSGGSGEQSYGLDQEGRKPQKGGLSSLAFPPVPSESETTSPAPTSAHPKEPSAGAIPGGTGLAPLAKAADTPQAEPAVEPGERTTTIGRTIIIRGKLTSDENLIVRGRIEAEINSSKDLLLEETGIINADMRIKSVTISGIVVGDIHAQERVKLAPEARVVGDIYTPRLVVEDGATFRGRVEMEGLEHLEGVKPSKPGETQPSSDATATAAATTETASGDAGALSDLPIADEVLDPQSY